MALYYDFMWMAYRFFHLFIKIRILSVFYLIRLIRKKFCGVSEFSCCTKVLYRSEIFVLLSAVYHRYFLFIGHDATTLKCSWFSAFESNGSSGLETSQHIGHQQHADKSCWFWVGKNLLILYGPDFSGKWNYLYFSSIFIEC